jgi:hypothetical protein
LNEEFTIPKELKNSRTQKLKNLLTWERPEEALMPSRHGYILNQDRHSST